MIQEISSTLNTSSSFKPSNPCPAPLVWVLADAKKVGTLHQATGFAQALNVTPLVFPVVPRLLWRLIPRSHWHTFSIKNKGPASFSSPWPDIVVSAGNAATAAAAALKQKRGDRLCSIALMNPRLEPHLFDIIIPPVHDDLSGPNIIPSRLSFHELTHGHLKREKEKWAPRFKHLCPPYCSVLLGGHSRHFRFSRDFIRTLGHKLRTLAKQSGLSLLITPSRRTPSYASSLLAKILSDVPHFIWNNKNENPYHGLLSLSDYLIVTGDSVQMLSEAAFTKTPLFVYDVPEMPLKIRQFHHFLFREKIAHPFQNQLFYWIRPSYNNMPYLVNQVRHIIQEKHPHLLSKIATNAPPITSLK